LQLKESSRGLSKSEKGELARLDALFAEEDRIRERAGPLREKKLAAKFWGGEPLSEAETRELAELEERLPPPDATGRVVGCAWSTVPVLLVVMTRP